MAVTMQGDAGNPDAATTHDVEPTDGSYPWWLPSPAAPTPATMASCSPPACSLRKAAALGLKVLAYVKTSIAPGSRIAARYFANNDLTAALDSIGFSTVGYGCTTCIGNSGPLNSALEEAVVKHNLVSWAPCSPATATSRPASTPHVKANFSCRPRWSLPLPWPAAWILTWRLSPWAPRRMAPPCTCAISGPRARKRCRPGPPPARQTMPPAMPATCRRGDGVSAPTGAIFAWNADSTYIHRPPFFDGFDGRKGDITDIVNARLLGIFFGDSVTTDHISFGRCHRSPPPPPASS